MLFITKYSEGINSFGGMVRVKDIEKLTSNPSFLTISLINPLINEKIKNSKGNTVNVIGFFRIIKIFRIMSQSQDIYFHTVGNFIKSSCVLPFLGNKRWFIDLHGAQPEEFSYMQKQTVSRLFRFFEMLAFRFCDYYIHVSKNMENHFRNRYPRSKGKHIYAPILSPNIDVRQSIDLCKELVESRKKLELTLNKPIFLYSGGIQEWQKVEKIIEFSKKVIENDSVMIILSGQSDFFEKRLSSLISSNNLIIKSVVPEELSKYYLAANYGVMFRDDNILNIVSSPTKMSEYLYYGMLPVLSSLNVGDFVNLGVDYVKEDVLEHMPSHNALSTKNHKIMCELIESSDFQKLRDLFNDH